MKSEAGQGCREWCGCGWEEGCALHRLIKESCCDKMTFKLRPEGVRKSGQLTSWRQGSKHGHQQGSILCVFEEKQREEMAVMWWIQERVVENEVTEELREKSCRILKAQWRTLGFKASEMGSCWKVCSEHWLYLICVLKRLQRDELYGNGRHRETSLKPSAKVWEREIKITWLG